MKKKLSSDSVSIANLLIMINGGWLKMVELLVIIFIPLIVIGGGCKE